LISTLAIIAMLLNTTIRPRYLYSPCIFAGAAVSILAAFAVGHDHVLSAVSLTISILPETGSFAIPFGLVAILNQRAAREGKHVSTALQMALLNCCVTVGQQICTLTLAFIQTGMSLEKSLPYVFMVAAAALIIAGVGALFLDDKADPDTAEMAVESSSEEAEQPNLDSADVEQPSNGQHTE